MNTLVSIDEALDMIPLGMFHYRLLVLCGFSFMTDALEISLLTFLSTCAGAEWHLSNAQKATITGIVFIGIVLGSLFWGQFADRCGRRFSYLVSMSVISVGALLSGASPNYQSLILFRAIAGFGIGGATVPFDLFSEFLPGNCRGFYLICLEFFWCLGSMLVAAVAWASLESLGWRFLVYSTIIPVIVATILSIVYLPESPRWLWIKGRRDEAMEVIRNAATINGVEISSQIKLIEFATVSTTISSESEPEASYWDLVSTAAARRITIPLWVIWTVFGFTYYGTILFITRMFSNHDDLSSSSDSHENLQCEFNYPAIFYNSTSEILAVAIAAFAIDNVGRVKTQSLFYALGALAVVFMSFNISFGFVLVFSILARISAMASSVATWVATPELFNTHLRTVGHGSSSAISKLGAFLSPFLVMSNASNVQVGLTLGICQLFAVIAAHCLPETAGSVMKEHMSVDQDLDTLHDGHSSPAVPSTTGQRSPSRWPSLLPILPTKENRAFAPVATSEDNDSNVEPSTAVMFNPIQAADKIRNIRGEKSHF